MQDLREMRRYGSMEGVMDKTGKWLKSGENRRIMGKKNRGD